MIVGIGSDIVNINRIESAINYYGDKFLQRIFTQSERNYCDKSFGERRIIRYANRFAAKEATLKAIGIKSGISWQDIEVVNDANGKPFLRLSGGAHNNALQLANPYNLHLSLSDDSPYSVAFVILSINPKP
jgi:holo-[acyl-carrier protein] synthase